MPIIAQSAPTFLLRLRRGLSTHLVARLLLLLGLGLVAYGYSLVWLPQGNGPSVDVEQLTRQAIGGILLVSLGAALVGALVLWRDWK